MGIEVVYALDDICFCTLYLLIFEQDELIRTTRMDEHSIFVFPLARLMYMSARVSRPFAVKKVLLASTRAATLCFGTRNRKDEKEKKTDSGSHMGVRYE